MSKITSSALDPLEKLSKSINKWWRELSSGDRDDAIKSLPNNTDFYTYTLMSGKKFHLVKKEISHGREIYDIFFVSDSPDYSVLETKKNVREEEILEEVRKWVRREFKDDEEDGESFESIIDVKTGEDLTQKASEEHVKESTNSSTRFRLKRIVGEKEDEIRLVKIQCNSSATVSLDTVDTILGDDEFAESIPEGETTYEITDVGEELDVNPVEGDVDTSNTYTDIMGTIFLLHNTMKAIQWNAVGREFDKVQSICETLGWDCMYLLDTLAQSSYEEQGYVPNPVNCVDSSRWIEGMKMSSTTCIDILQGAISEAVTVIDTLRCNLPENIQTMCLSNIYTFKQQLIKIQRFQETE